MRQQTSDIVDMRFKTVNTLERVVVENSDTEVIGAADRPVFARHKKGGSNRHLTAVEAFDQSAALVVVDMELSRVKCDQCPRFTGVQIRRLNSLAHCRVHALIEAFLP